MFKRFLFILALCFGFQANVAIADCEATVALKDWRGGFQTLASGFDWCFERSSEWGLDLSDGWKARYCSHTTRYDSYGGITGYDFLFFHNDRSYRAKYSRSIFYAIDVDYGQRVFQGFPARLELFFSSGCGKDGSYDDDYKY